MDKNGRFIIVIITFLLVSSLSNASNSTTNSSSTTPLKTGSESNITVNGSKGSNSSGVIGKGEPKETQGSGNLTVVGSEGSKNGSNATDVLPLLKSKSDEEKGKVGNTKNEEVGSGESCEGALQECRIEKTLLACMKMPKDGSKERLLVLRNEGENRLEVKVYNPASVEKDSVPLNKLQTKAVNISSTLTEGNKIVIEAGNGKCVLILRRFGSMDNLVQQFNLYSKQVTPIYGAYFFFLLALVFSGSWACCKLRKKRHNSGGVPYQELEMGLPESTSAGNVDTAEGWDQGWDDDWDDDNAVTSPGGQRLGNISANGLTARSAKKDGWENDWDD